MQALMQMLQPILEVSHLTKTFHLHLVDGRTIEPFADVSFHVNRGEIFMISGKSGIGKTTILKCIYRTYLTTSGDIWYNSQYCNRVNIATASEDVVMKLREDEIAFCAQFLKVLPRVSAVDVTAEPLVRRGMALADAREEAEQWLRRLDIEQSRWQASPVTFSGGEQQRLNLARAFIARPRFLLLDEPTASLDAASKSIVLEMIREARTAGMTILTVSHDTAAMEPLVDNVYCLGMCEI